MIIPLLIRYFGQKPLKIYALQYQLFDVCFVSFKRAGTGKYRSGVRE